MGLKKTMEAARGSLHGFSFGHFCKLFDQNWELVGKSIQVWG